MKIRILVVVEPDDGGFHAYCPAFQGLHIDGSTVEVALARTVLALELYLSSLEQHGDTLPVGPDCVVIQGQPHPPVFTASADALLENVEMLWPLQVSGIS